MQVLRYAVRVQSFVELLWSSFGARTPECVIGRRLSGNEAPHNISAMIENRDMNHDDQVTLAKALLAKLESKTPTADASGPWHFELNPRMGDTALQRERERILLSSPGLFAFSSSLPEPETYQTVDLSGRSVLLTRDSDGTVHAFDNACIHRGAKLVDEGCGKAARLVCPYHGWAYDSRGRFVGAPLADCFPDIQRHTTSLAELPTVEKDGLIWGVLDRSQGDALDSFVRQLPPEFATFAFQDHQVYLQQSRTWNFNWKLGVDTFLENYHFTVLHRNTVAGRIIGNVSINDDFGRVRRSILARDTLKELRDKPESTWDVLPRVVSTYFIYPNTILFFFGDRCETWRMEPGADWRTCKVQYALYAPEPAETSEAAQSKRNQYFDSQAAAALKIVEIEDFPVAEGIQSTMEQGQISEVVYGQNEPNLALFYQRIRDDLGHDGE